MTASAAAPDIDVALIPTADIEDVGNTRHELRNLESLAASMRRHGLLTAIAVEPLPEGGFRLAAGSRRLAAAKLAELKRVPAVIVPPGGDATAVLRRLAENHDREPLTELEEADAIQQLLEIGADAELVASTVHTTVENVDAWRAVAALPPQVRELVSAGAMTARDAHHLTAVSDDAELLDDCLRRIGQGWQVKSAVETARREQKRRTEEEKTRARLAKEGCPVVDPPTYGYYSANSRTQRLGQAHGDVRIAKRDHAKQPCHAAFVGSDGRPTFVCTDRSRHAGVPGTGVPDLKAERAAKRAEKKALREAHATRFRTIGEALRNHAFTRDEAIAHVLRLWLDEAKPAICEVAAELLGLPLGEDGGALAAEEALTARAGEGQEALVDIALAIALAAGEQGLTTDRFDYSREAVAAHVRFLRATGVHELTDVEMEAARGRLPWEARGELAGDVNGTDDEEGGLSDPAGQMEQLAEAEPFADQPVE
jgi:ParB/RepB/Spo0J family partition protein